MVFRINNAAYSTLLYLFKLAFADINFPPLIKLPNSEDGSHFLIRRPPGGSNDIRLHCQADEYDTNTAIFWRMKGAVPLPFGWQPANTTQNADPNYIPNAPFLASSIMISDLKFGSSPRHFEGDYECVVSNSAGVAVSGPVTLQLVAVISPTVEVNQELTTHEGQTLVMPCCSTGPLRITPSINDPAIVIVWHRVTDPVNPFHGETETGIDFKEDLRFMMDDVGTLYIRNVSRQDFNGTKTYRCRVRLYFGAYVTEGLVGSYSAKILNRLPERYASLPRLLYKSQDVTVVRGSLVRLSCIFYDAGNPTGLVNWDGPAPTDQVLLAGSLIVLLDVNWRHSGNWQCSYHGPTGPLSESIKVTVLELPLLATIPDTYVATGGEVTLVCNTRNDVPATFQWYLNDAVFPKASRFRIQATASSSTLSISSVEMSESGVVSCSASNAAATFKTNSRLIIYDNPTITVSQLNATTLLEIAIGVPRLLLGFRCEFKIDPRASHIAIHFTISSRVGLIDDTTSDEVFGIKSPAVSWGKTGVAWLKLIYDPNYHNNFVGSCGCRVKFKLLHNEYFIEAGTTINTDNYRGREWWWIPVTIICIPMFIFLCVLMFFYVKRSLIKATQKPIATTAPQMEVNERASSYITAVAYFGRNSTASSFWSPEEVTKKSSVRGASVTMHPGAQIGASLVEDPFG